MKCRLLQGPGNECMECRSPLMASLANQRGLLKRNMSKAATKSKRRLGGEAVGAITGAAAYTGLIAGTVFFWPVLPIVLGGGAVVGGALWWKHRHAIAAVDELEPALAGASVKRTGIAHRLTETVKSVTGEPVMAEEAVVARKQDVLFRRLSSVPFLVEIDGGGTLVVLGLVRVATKAERLGKVKAGNAHLVSLGVEGVPVAGELTLSVVRDGDRVTITGEEKLEIVPELAVHRDAAETPVMRGRAGAVALIRPA